ncbi:MAG: 4Fe-4S dicluster domain-containing protein [Gammaproteobacteria bacterium]|nr:4Fe-4S dicluster domain-containing protein [Gammaproteobacteria bacterium]
MSTMTTSRRSFLRALVAVAGSAAVAYRPSALASLVGGKGSMDTTDADYVFVVDIDRCIGCGKCVQACSVENHVPAGHFRTWVERYVRTAEGTWIDSPDGAINSFPPLAEDVTAAAKETTFVPKLCNQCDNAPCVQVCPVGATFKAPGGFVLIDPEHCMGCSYCIQACPFGVRFLNPATHMADKCDWCYHRVSNGLQPACATVCPTGARAFGDRNKPEGTVAEALEEDRWRILKPGMHAHNRVLYRRLPREVI